LVKERGKRGEVRSYNIFYYFLTIKPGFQ
jgi:hypothetical protein